MRLALLMLATGLWMTRSCGLRLQMLWQGCALPTLMQPPGCSGNWWQC